MGVKGNKFWEARSTHGRSLLYDDPEVFRNACFQYFQWVDENPLIEEKPMIEDKCIARSFTPKMRAMTITGIARFVGMTHETWIRYKHKEDFSEVVGEAEEIIREQKLVGAAAGFLNPNIIARDLGLKEGIDHTTGGEKITMTDDQLNARIAALEESNASDEP